MYNMKLNSNTSLYSQGRHQA